MVKNACKKGNTDYSFAFLSVFILSKDAIRSFGVFSKKPTVERGLALAQQRRDSFQRCLFLKGLAQVAQEQGRHTQAEVYLQEGLALARQREQREEICTLLDSLGLIASQQENYAQAEVYFQEGLALAREIGKQVLIDMILPRLGDVCFKQGHLEQAETIYREIYITLAKENQILAAFVQYKLAQVEAARGNITVAHRMGEEALEVLEEKQFEAAIEVRLWLETVLETNNELKQ